jgi:hypothetical protein
MLNYPVTASSFAAIAILILAAMLISGCIVNLAGEWQGEELERVKSPDGIVDAVLVRGDTGATTSYSYLIYLVPSGARLDKDPQLFEPNQAMFDTLNQKDLQMIWTKPKFIEIRHRKDVTSNSSFLWHSREVQNDGYLVEVKLVPRGEAVLKNGQ